MRVYFTEEYDKIHLYTADSELGVPRVGDNVSFKNPQDSSLTYYGKVKAVNRDYTATPYVKVLLEETTNQYRVPA